MVSDADDSDGRGGALARGWTPSPRLRAVVLVVVGLVLVVHPIVGGLPDAVGLSGTVTYTAYEVTPTEDGFDYRPLADVDEGALSASSRLYTQGGLTLLDCYPEHTTRPCELEATLVDQPATAESAPVDWHGYTYHDGFYERVATAADDGTVTLRLRPVAGREVLHNISIPARDWGDTTRRAVESGQVSADPRALYAGSMLERDGEYYIVLPPRGIPRDEPMGPTAAALSAGAGALLVRRAVRVADGE